MSITIKTSSDDTKSDKRTTVGLPAIFLFFTLFFGLLFLALAGLEIVVAAIVAYLGGTVVATIFGSVVFIFGFILSLLASSSIAGIITRSITSFTTWIFD